MNTSKARTHWYISMTKSVWRLVGYVFLIPFPIIGVAILVVSEILGIAEEIWGA